MTKLDKIVKLESKSRQRLAKRSQRKEELASAAIDALKQLGYARTSLRDIAESSGVSVGMLHYYFVDKTDLIKFCVRKYKAGFVTELDSVMDNSAPGSSLAEAFAGGLTASIRREAEMHRLWYDIRTQALFDADFQDVVEDIEGELVALVSRLFRRLDLPEEMVLSAYLSLDGAFRYCLQRHLADDQDALPQFHRQIIAQIGGATASGQIAPTAH